MVSRLAALAARALQTAVDASEAFKQAFEAVYRGWPAFPCDSVSKKPAAVLLRHATGSPGWKVFQSRAPTLRELECWQDCSAFAVVTGATSGVVVLDVEYNGADSVRDKHLPPTVIATTPRGGWHYYFRHQGEAVKTCTGVLPHVDVRGDGGYALLPGPEGRAWVPGHSPADIELAPLPEWLAKLVVLARKEPKPRKQSNPLPLVEKPQNQFAPPAQSFAGAPVPLRGIRGDAFSAWFANDSAVQRMAHTLGVSADALGQPFSDVLPGPPDDNPSASLYRNKSGVWVYRSWRLPGHQFFYLADVRASQAYGKPVRLCDTNEQGGVIRARPEAAVWALRLLVEAGLTRLVDVPHKALPSGAPPSVAKVYEGFLFLLGCKWLHTANEPTPFAWRFASAWCGVGERQVGEAIKWLLKFGYIQCTGKHKRTHLFLPLGGDA